MKATMRSVITLTHVTPDGSWVRGVYGSLEALRERFDREDLADHSSYGEDAETVIMGWDGKEALELLPDDPDCDGCWVLQMIEVTE